MRRAARRGASLGANAPWTAAGRCLYSPSRRRSLKKAKGVGVPFSSKLCSSADVHPFPVYARGAARTPQLGSWLVPRGMDAACPTASPAGSSSLISETACAGELPRRDASRYFSLRPAAGGPGVWLFARSGEWPDSDTRDVVVRRWANCDVDLLASDACRSSVVDITARGDLNSENLAHLSLIHI